MWAFKLLEMGNFLLVEILFLARMMSQIFLCQLCRTHCGDSSFGDLAFFCWCKEKFCVRRTKDKQIKELGLRSGYECGDFSFGGEKCFVDCNLMLLVRGIPKSSLCCV